MRTNKSKLNIFIKILFVILFIFTSSVFADNVQLTSIAVNTQGSQTQVIINLSGPTSYSVFSLGTPNRVVIDLKSTTLATTTDQTNLVNTPIEKIRHGHPTSDTYRIVLDVDKPLKYSSVLNGNQLVVTLIDTSGPMAATSDKQGIFSNPDKETTSTQQTITPAAAAVTINSANSTAPSAPPQTTADENNSTSNHTANENLAQAKKWAQENLQAELQDNIAQESSAAPATTTNTTAQSTPPPAVITNAPVVKSTPLITNNVVNNVPANKPKTVVTKPVIVIPPVVSQPKPQNPTPVAAVKSPANTATVTTNTQVVKSNPVATTSTKTTTTKNIATPTKTAVTNTSVKTTPVANQATTAVSTTVITAPPATGNRIITIVIDPGHGGKDPGTTGSFGVREKDVVLAISKDLYAILSKQPGYHPVLTRSGDYFIPLRGRLAIAREAHGDMFIAIHADAYSDSYATGASVYALSAHGASSEAARWLAEKENYSELGGVQLGDKSDLLRSVLIDLSQTATIGSSIQLGTDLLSQLNSVGTLHHNVVEQAPFMVLKSPDIPSVLVETGFLSSPTEEERLHNPIHQQEIAMALAKGIENYFWTNPPPGTTIASLKNSKSD